MKNFHSPLLEQIFSRVTPQQSTCRGIQIAQQLSRLLGFPHLAYPCIHIAGSNGKGSVSTKIAFALKEAGHRVGLYTSPHLFSFHERIVVNFEPIDQESVEAGLKKLIALDEQLGLQATFFEFATILAFDYFRNQKVTVAVIETGLGGRLDATNIVDPILTAITSIHREHASILGDDLETIAMAKAGIIKPGVPHVVGPHARQQAIYTEAIRLNCPIYEVEHKSLFYDDENSAIARQCLSLLAGRFGLKEKHVTAGVCIRPACRFERIGNVIFDVAHNPAAFRRLIQALNICYPSCKYRFLIGLCEDKDYVECLHIAATAASHIHLVQGLTSRAVPTHKLAAALNGTVSCSCHQEIGPAMRQGQLLAEQNEEILVVTGSFYIMLGAKKAL